MIALQERSILCADELFVVSRKWQDYLRVRFGRAAVLTGNGVDADRFSAQRDGRETMLRQRFGLSAGPVFLAIGGVEERKNTIGILQAFADIRQSQSQAQLLLAGGASLLDHAEYQDRFVQAYAASCLPPGAVVRDGPLPQADMPAFTSVIWCIGFQPDFRWLDAPVFNGTGHPKHYRGATAQQGVFFLGLPWLHSWGSGRFSGVARDASYLADRIADNIHLASRSLAAAE